MSEDSAEMVSVKIIPNMSSHPPGKLADAEVVFEADAGPLRGLKLIGFAVWERRKGGKNVTFPARPYSTSRLMLNFRDFCACVFCPAASAADTADTRTAATINMFILIVTLSDSKSRLR